MAQAMLEMDKTLPRPSNQVGEIKFKGKCKVVMTLKDDYSVLVARRRDKLSICINKGARNLSLSEDFLQELCELKESILLCCSVLRNQHGK